MLHDENILAFEPDDPISRLVHQLRNPLAVIVGYLELLEVAEDTATREHALQRVRQAATRLETLLASPHLD